jgi:hypothetical protein
VGLFGKQQCESNNNNNNKHGERRPFVPLSVPFFQRRAAVPDDYLVESLILMVVQFLFFPYELQTYEICPYVRLSISIPPHHGCHHMHAVVVFGRRRGTKKSPTRTQQLFRHAHTFTY